MSGSVNNNDGLPPNTPIYTSECKNRVHKVYMQLLMDMSPYTDLEKVQELLTSEDFSEIIATLNLYMDGIAELEEEIKVYSYQHENNKPVCNYNYSFPNVNIVSLLGAISMKLNSLENTLLTHGSRTLENEVLLFWAEARTLVGLVTVQTQSPSTLKNRANWIFPTHVYQ